MYTCTFAYIRRCLNDTLYDIIQFLMNELLNHFPYFSLFYFPYIIEIDNK